MPTETAPIVEWPAGCQRYARHCRPHLLPAFAGVRTLKWRDAVSFYAELEAAGLKWPERALLGLVDRYYLMLRILHREDMLLHGDEGHDPPGNIWLYERCRMVEAEPDGYLDLWARGHYKSSIITQAGCIQEIARNPEITIAILSFSNKIAKPFLAQLMTEMEQNADLKAAYPDVFWDDPARQAPRWSKDDGIIVKRKGTPKENTVEAYGLVDGQPIGRHFDMLIYNDVVTNDAVTTSEMSAKVTERWSVSNALGKRGTRRRGEGTRWAVGDTYEHIENRRALKVRIFPATVDGTMMASPVLLTERELDDKRREMGSTFGAQMLLNPAAGSNAMFRPAWFKSYEIRPRTINVYILCDPSKGRTQRSDRTGIAVVGVDAGGNKYFLDGYCHRMNMPERWEKLKELHKRWSRKIGVENVAVGYEQYGMQSDDEFFETQMEREGYEFGIEIVAWPRDNKFAKEDRVERLVPDVRDGRFFFPLVVYDEQLSREATWSINERSQIELKWPPDRDGKPVINVTTKLRAIAVQNSQAYRVIGPIKAIDENGRVYDVVMRLLEEMAHFPFSLRKDLVDATSRIYDMTPVPPVIVKPEMVDPPAFVD